MTAIRLDTHCIQWEGASTTKKIFYRTSTCSNVANVLYEERGTGWLARLGWQKPYRVTCSQTWMTQGLGLLRNFSQRITDYILPVFLFIERDASYTEYALAGVMTLSIVGYAVIAGPVAAVAEIASIVILELVFNGLLQNAGDFGRKIKKYFPLSTALPHAALGVAAWLPSAIVANGASSISTSCLKLCGCSIKPEQDVVDIMRRPRIGPVMASYAMVGAPLIEEVLFRGLLQDWFNSQPTEQTNGCIQRVRDKWNEWVGTSKHVDERFSSARIKTILKVSVLFGLVHMTFNQGWLNVPVFIVTTILGIVQGLLREATGDLWAPLSMHSMNNTMCVLQVYGVLPV